MLFLSVGRLAAVDGGEERGWMVPGGMEECRLLLDLEIMQGGVELLDFLDDVVAGVNADVVLSEVDRYPSRGWGEAFRPGVPFRN